MAITCSFEQGVANFKLYKHLYINIPLLHFLYAFSYAIYCCKPGRGEYFEDTGLQVLTAVLRSKSSAMSTDQ